MSPYKISGAERKKLKKEISGLKYFVKMFWHYEDIDRVYGGGLSDDECNSLLEENGEEIKQLELILKEPSTQIKRDLKIEELGILNELCTNLNSQKVFNYDKWKITLDGFYDDDYSGWRWSVDVSYPGGTMTSCGYGPDNEILYKTQKEALEYAIEIICGWRADGKELRRDMRLKLILDL